jgi:hypothetical protein
MTEMKIKNSTVWDTADLRRVFAAVLTQSNKVEGNFPSKRLKIDVVYTKGGGYSGCAWLHTGRMTIRVPRPRAATSLALFGPTEVDVFSLAWLFEHELAHCRGFKHDQMGCLNNWPTAERRKEMYPCVAGMKIGLAPVKPAKPKPDAQAVRHAAAVAQLMRWKTKAKRAATGVKKAQARVRYYERVAAAKPPAKI